MQINADCSKWQGGHVTLSCLWSNAWMCRKQQRISTISQSSVASYLWQAVLVSRLKLQGEILFHDAVVGVLLSGVMTLIKQQQTDVFELHSFFSVDTVQSVDKYLGSHHDHIIALKKVLKRDVCWVGSRDFTHWVLPQVGFKSLLLLQNKVYCANNEDNAWFLSAGTGGSCSNEINLVDVI